MNKNTYVAIMAGGIGSRFWPMSRTDFPKQFLDILNTGRTLYPGNLRQVCKIYCTRKYLHCYIGPIPGYNDKTTAGT